MVYHCTHNSVHGDFLCVGIEEQDDCFFVLFLDIYIKEHSVTKIGQVLARYKLIKKEFIIQVVSDDHNTCSTFFGERF